MTKETQGPAVGDLVEIVDRLFRDGPNNLWTSSHYGIYLGHSYSGQRIELLSFDGSITNFDVFSVMKIIVVSSLKDALCQIVTIA